MLIANMIEEEALMGGVGVVSALSRGDIALLEIAIPQKLRHFKMNDGVPVDVIDLPEGSLLVAVDRREYGGPRWRLKIWCSTRAIRPSWLPSTISSMTFARYSALCKPLLRGIECYLTIRMPFCSHSGEALGERPEMPARLSATLRTMRRAPVSRFGGK